MVSIVCAEGVWPGSDALGGKVGFVEARSTTNRVGSASCTDHCSSNPIEHALRYGQYESGMDPSFFDLGYSNWWEEALILSWTASETNP